MSESSVETEKFICIYTYKNKVLLSEVEKLLSGEENIRVMNITGGALIRKALGSTGLFCRKQYLTKSDFVKWTLLLRGDCLIFMWSKENYRV